MKYFIFIIILILSFSSCKQEDYYIDNTSKNYNVLVSIGGTNPRLALFSFPDGKLINDNVLGANNSKIANGKITKIVEFMDKIYLIIPEKFKIEVVAKVDYKPLATYDFFNLQLTPTDICFPNATDAYVAMEKHDEIALIDIYYNKFVRTIKVGQGPSSISASGNQVYVANKLDNNISVIDLSLNKGVVATIDVAPNPSFIGFNSNNEVYVISNGSGKLDSNAKSEAKITFINPIKRSVINTLDIGSGTSTSAINQIPNFVAYSNKTYGYIATNEALFRVDLKYKDKIKLITKTQYDKVYFNILDRTVILMKKSNSTTNFIIADEISVIENSNITLNYEIEALLTL